ncbi:Ubiquitin carboxylterminal hydrolase 15, putative [Acanthamoeba castellanii str. Neff]|uniref:ubiquitinyl hydrolase 1 n=1 Tax=Acanthamoeba castellanii (strain ATCC 30010 / Neff) TaxID=1257118 RepID=L8HKZ1_ACACF|nr:Ubiquitin carboxylterminal hydrolase 15, putative [Acanthamoeba castellanii str. Neff]ELR25343.1 Ubiquitin carboxylterminal hydrolase 15, putative [Acanthamoeba castellanii str. Neff]
MMSNNEDVETTNRGLERHGHVQVELGDKEEDLMEATNEEEEENADEDPSSSSSDEEEDDDMGRDKEAEEDGSEATQTAAAQNEEEDDPEANWEAKLPEPEAGGPAAEKRLIKELDWERKKTGKNQTWYLLSAKWLEDWKTYVDYDDAESDSDEDDEGAEKVRPGPITNSMLLEPQSDYLRRECTEGRHYIIVPEEAWRLWWKWYAGGPPLPRKTVTTGWYNQQYVVEVRLLHLKFVKSSDKNVELPSSFSKTATIGDLKKRMCKRLKVDPANVRLWDWHARNKIKLLTDMTDTLDEAQIIDNQLVLFEEKDPATGKFPEDTYGSSYRASGYGSSSTYGSSSGYGSSSIYGSSSYSYSRYSEPGEPGVCGLQNLGNTCFMNSALQCLSNTAPLTNFFLRGTYKDDVNEVNPLGTKGELVEAYTGLLREIWSGSARSTPPRSFKYKLERFAPQFSGYQQHDSQELLGFLLDGIHEDLNRIKQKPYVESKEADGRPDTEVAEETWQGHRARNDSVIVDRFQGQLKSTLICPECSKVSITFDPFMYLSLPLPMKMTRRLAVTFISRDPARRPVKYALDVPKHGSIKELRMAVAVFVGVDARNLILADLYNSRFFKEYSDRESLDVIQDRDVTVVYELPPNPAAEEKAKVEPEPEPEPVEDPSDDDDQVWGDGYSYRSMGVSRATAQPKVEEPKDGIIQVRVLNRKDETVTHRTYYGTPTSYTRKTLFGVPFILQIPNKITYADLYREALHQLQRFLKGMPDQVPVEEPMEAEQETQEQAAAEEQQPQQQEEQAADQTGIEEAEEPVHSGESRASAKKNKGESYGSDNEHDDDSFSSSSDEAEPSYSRSSSSYRQPVETKAPVIPESIDGRPLLFTLKLVDHFGVNDHVEFSGGKHGEEVITLKNTQTVALCWRNESLSFYDDEKEIDMEVHPSARPVERDEGDQSVSLYDCLELFTQAEQLGPEDPWYCNKCAEFRQATKKFDVWKVPRILVVHLKRFSYRNKYWREKLDTFVDFPLDDLDLSPHVLGPVSTPPVYELYAVSNHYGSLGGGHYTAYAKNHRENKWYKFDDSSVSSVQAESVKTSAAYVLFYRLKEDASEWRGLSVAEAESGETAAPSAESATTATTAADAADDDSSSSSSDSEDAEPEHSDADGEAGDVDMQDPEGDQ